MSFFEAVKTVLSKYAVFSGRARRKEYWYFFLFNVIVGFIIGFLGGAMQKPKAMTALSIAFTLAFLLPSIAVAVRRLHDTGKSGWWLLINFVPFGGLILLIFMIMDSTPGDNMYGPNPKGV